MVFWKIARDTYENNKFFPKMRSFINSIAIDFSWRAFQKHSMSGTQHSTNTSRHWRSYRKPRPLYRWSLTEHCNRGVSLLFMCLELLCSCCTWFAYNVHVLAPWYFLRCHVLFLFSPLCVRLYWSLQTTSLQIMEWN